MLSNDRIGLMIRMAKEDTPKMQRFRNIAGYYKNDYIALTLIRRFIVMTVAYILVVGLLAIASMDFINENINRFDFKVLFADIVIGYVIFVGVYLLISYLLATVRYNSARKARRDYEERLRVLGNIYRREEKK